MHPIVQEIQALFEQHGQDNYYGEPVSQFEHAAQTALLAQRDGYDAEVQVAAFLHDIGHLLPSEAASDHMADYGRTDHETLAADWLWQRGFSERVCQLIAHHVNAKRYLTATNPAYYAALSEASKQTLEFQGGSMSAAEAAEFEQNPYFDLIIRARRWDEAAKVKDLKTNDLAHYLTLCELVLEQ
jgi:2-amino-1-hydroxyethylphosphonate dioxygenase (glycine-forming)